MRSAQLNAIQGDLYWGMTGFHPAEAAHALDVLDVLLNAAEAGESIALGVVTETEGGGVRRPGALFGVTDSLMAGYISHGCVDNDVAFQAREAMAENRPRRLEYGSNSPYADVQLPCRGNVRALIVPHPDPGELRDARDRLAVREVVELSVFADEVSFTSGGTAYLKFRLLPKMRLHVAGRGGEALSLARLALANRQDFYLRAPDRQIVELVNGLGGQAEYLSRAEEAAGQADDPWTAFLSLFHEHDWEGPLLTQALSGPAFYIGALGSRRAHETRCADLAASGVPAADIVRIRGPIGLIPRTRDCHMLAVSALAEIAKVFHEEVS